MAWGRSQVGVGSLEFALREVGLLANPGKTRFPWPDLAEQPLIQAFDDSVASNQWVCT
jgi:hypothetical protein